MHTRLILLACLVAAPLLGTTAPAAGATHPAFVVGLHEDGSADVAVTYRFALETDADREAFESYRTNATARQAWAGRFENRIASVAVNAAAATGREMRVDGGTATVTTDGSTGLVTLNVTWDGLAVVRDGDLVVTEPFASGFEPDRPLVVVPPDGYEASATPAPDETTDGRLTWDAGSDLSGFELTASAPGDAGTSGAFGPGIGAVGAVAALVGGGLIARRRR